MLLRVPKAKFHVRRFGPPSTATQTILHRPPLGSPAGGGPVGAGYHINSSSWTRRDVRRSPVSPNPSWLKSRTPQRQSQERNSVTQ